MPYIKVPRCLIPSGEIRFFLLHVFTNAWQKAYAAVLYARCVQINGEIFSNIVMSKSRVASLKLTGIPRLKLFDVVLGLN